MSSTSFVPGKDLSPARCIDGVVGSEWEENFCLSDMRDDASFYDPWLSVELPAGSRVSAVDVYPRQDSMQDKLSIFQVWVGDQAGDISKAPGMVLCGRMQATASAGPFTVTCSTPMPGTIATVRLPKGGRTLALSEVIVHGTPGDQAEATPVLPARSAPLDADDTSSPLSACTPSGMDRYGTGSSGPCCEQQCTEQRPLTDPMFSVYPLVVFCRTQCEPADAIADDVDTAASATTGSVSSSLETTAGGALATDRAKTGPASTAAEPEVVQPLNVLAMLAVAGALVGVGVVGCLQANSMRARVARVGGAEGVRARRAQRKGAKRLSDEQEQEMAEPEVLHQGDIEDDEGAKEVGAVGHEQNKQQSEQVVAPHVVVM